jgi:prophage regulatory protein
MVEVVGVPEIGQILGVSRQRVYQLMETYEDFPAPLATLAVGRVWSRAAIEEWDQKHGERPTGRHRRLRLD